ncbi:MAG: M20/M25/M40 family metallo-hydrolase, partial [Candidatus Methylomirabilales bacterium]
LRGSLGLMPHEEVKDVERQLLEQIRRTAESDAWLREHPPVVEFKEVGADGAEIPVAHPIVQTLARAHTAVTRQAPVFSGRTGGADTRYLIKHGKTPTVIFGPGLTAEMHAVNESVPVSNLVVATKVVALSIAEWCGGA